MLGACPNDCQVDLLGDSANVGSVYQVVARYETAAYRDRNCEAVSCRGHRLELVFDHGRNCEAMMCRDQIPDVGALCIDLALDIVCVNWDAGAVVAQKTST